MAEDGPAFGNFKLSLQSVVCHQGESTESGHYVSLVRCPNPEQPSESRWMRFDDLADERVLYTNVDTFLLQESPYLLFYQVIPIEDDASGITKDEDPLTDLTPPPAYSESNLSRGSKIDSGISGLSSSPRMSYTSNERPTRETPRPSLEIRRPSSEASVSDEAGGGRLSTASDRSQNVIFSETDSNIAIGAKQDFLNPPNLEITNQTDGPNSLTATRHGSKTSQDASKSRRSSKTDENRMSASLSRLASRISKDKLRSTGTTANATGSRTQPSGPNPASDQTKEPLGDRLSHAAALVAASEKALAPSEKPTDRGRLKKEAKEKSKAAQRDQQQLLKEKRKSDKPDRECLVM